MSPSGSGALGGAASGAAMGSVAGPWGAAIGGIAGGLYGAFSGGGGDDKPQYQDRDRILALINAGYGAPNAPAAGPQNAFWNQGQASPAAGTNGAGGQDITHIQAPQLQLGDDPFRRAQLAQLGQLQGIASGQQQGAGELATQRQYANAMAAQQAQARMARGGNAALAYRNAANQSAALGSTAAGMGQQAALQDQMNAQGLLGQVGSVGRAGDFNAANANANYQLATNQLNTGNYMQLLNALGGMDTGQLGAQAAAAQYGQQRNDAMLGAGISAAGQVLAANQRSGQNPVGPVQGNSGYTGDSSTWGA